MADNETPSAPTPDSTPATTAPLSPVLALLAEVAGSADTKGGAVRKIVIDELTQQELIKRKDAVLTLLNKHDEKSKELKKSEKNLAKIEFDAEGKETRRYFDAEGSKALKALRDEITNIATALSKFFNDNDVSKLYEIANKK